MEIADRMGHMRDQMHGRRIEGKLDNSQQENLRLKTEARALHDQLRDDRSDLSKVLSAIERSNARPPRHRLRRFVTLAAAAGGAYVMGAKAGRQRYDDIRDGWRRMARNGRSRVQDMRNRADGVIDEAQSVGERMSDAGQLIGETARAVAEGPSNAHAGPGSSPSSGSA
jgi:hypothetical protein